MEPVHRNLTQTAFSALLWNYGGALCQSVHQIVMLAIMARLLGPEPFGLVALAWVFIGLCNLVADFGLNATLVQAPSISEAFIRYVFTVQMMAAAALGLLALALADLVGLLLSRPALAPVLQVMSPVFVLQAMGLTSLALLRRRLEFRSIQKIQVFSTVLSFFLLGLPLALSGWGVWSLVAAQLAQKLVSSICFYALERHPLVPTLRCSERGKLGFGAGVMATNLLNWFGGSIDTLVIGKVFGVGSLGLYDRAGRLLVSSLESVAAVLRGVLFPAYSIRQGDLKAVKSAFLASVGALYLLVLPAFFCASLVSGTVIGGLYGEAWMDAAPVLVPLALAMPFRAMSSLCGPVMWGVGQVRREMRIQVFMVILIACVVLGGSRISVVVIAWGILFADLVKCCSMGAVVKNLLHISWRDWGEAFRGPLVLLAVSLSAVALLETVLQAVGAVAWVRLAADVCLGGACLMVVSLLWPRTIVSTHLSLMFLNVHQSLPPVFQKLFHGWSHAMGKDAC